MGSAGAVLAIASVQVVIALCLLGIYEGYKAHFLSDMLNSPPANDESKDVIVLDNDPDFSTPMDNIFYLSILINVFAVSGMAGVLNQQRELVVAFFVYNAIQMVAAFHFFVDVCADFGIRYSGQRAKLEGYQQAAAAFLFVLFCVSVAATLSAMSAVSEIRRKQREELTRMSVLSDTLQFQPDSSA